MGLEGGQGAVQQVTEPGIRKRGRQPAGLDRAEVLVVVVQHDSVAVDGGNALQGRGDAVVRRGDERAVPGDRLRLDPADRGNQVIVVHVLRQHTESAAAGERRCEPRTRHRVHVRGDQRDGRTRAIGRRQRDIQPARNGRTVRHQEDIGVGEV